tara:strand:- start:138 stop:260 length:123 start_codon:yes stop_codon:yes gene_type:complete
LYPKIQWLEIAKEQLFILKVQQVQVIGILLLKAKDYTQAE